MLRPAARSIFRSTQSSLAPARTLPTRRFVSTQQPVKRGRWQNNAIRWGLAIAGIYYYNTSAVFAEQPHNSLLNPNLDVHALEDGTGPSLDVLAARRQDKHTQIRDAAADAAALENASASTSASADRSVAATHEAGTPATSGPTQELEEEAHSEGAFNPETGEINWDCPCLGGMAHGPCGPEFRLAFSCFVFSEEDPKGMDCIEKFQGMRDCFQRYPEVYKDELAEDEELDRELDQEKQELAQQIKERRERDQELAAQGDDQPPSRLLEEAVAEPRVKVTRKVDQSNSSESRTRSTPNIEAADLLVDDDGLVPREAHDARDKKA
ncbi:hypothetical protein DV736_g6380, partial [Chaetothyriales sp. CBS 134916]